MNTPEATTAPAGIPISVRGSTIGGAMLGMLGMIGAGLIGLVSEGYAVAALDAVGSLYPGFHNSGGLIDLLVGTGYAIIHGALTGYLFAKFHNSVTRVEGRHEMFFCWPCAKAHLLGPWLVFHKRDH